MTASQYGTTDANGRFYYQPGETVRFYLQDLYIGQATASDVLTPSTIAPSGTNADYGLNLLRLLQTLDSDNTPSNGISLRTLSNTSGLDLRQTLDQSTTAFASSSGLSNVLAAAGVQLANLVSASKATAHFATTLQGVATTSSTTIDFTGRTATAIMRVDNDSCPNDISTSWTLSFGSQSVQLTGKEIDASQSPCVAQSQNFQPSSLAYVPSLNNNFTLQTNALFLPCGPVCTESELNQTYLGTDEGSRPFRAQVSYLSGSREIYLTKTFTDASTKLPRVIYFKTTFSP